MIHGTLSVSWFLPWGKTLEVTSLFPFPQSRWEAEMTYSPGKYGKIKQAGSSYFPQSSS